MFHGLVFVAAWVDLRLALCLWLEVVKQLVEHLIFMNYFSFVSFFMKLLSSSFAH
jgi:hypothetical protein